MQLDITPIDSRVDEPVAIRVFTTAGEQMTLRARAISDCGQPWESRAEFVADGSGVVDLGHHAPVAGTYSGVDPMGLFWSMRLDPAVPEREHRPFRSEQAEPERIQLSAEVEGRERVGVELIRRYLAPSMARRDVREEGLVGTLFYKRGERRPALIWLTGSSGGEVRGHAALLASRGFTCLSLAYFNAEALPKGLWEIPLEYFETAIRWLQRQDCVVPDALGATGISRGGELALLLGATFPQIRAVAAHVPSSVVWAGLGPGYAVNERSAWSYRGAPLPFLKGNAEGLNWRDKPVRLDQFYRNAMSDEAAVERAAIPVEKINGPVIMMSGTDDGMWPSTMMAELLMKRLKDKGFRHRAEHLCYQGAGHGIAHVYVPTTQILGFHQVARITVTGGGTPKVNSDANKDAWPKVVAFLHEALG